MASIEFEIGDRKWRQSIPGSVAEYLAGLGQRHIIEAIRKSGAVMSDEIETTIINAIGFGAIWADLVKVGEFQIRDD